MGGGWRDLSVLRLPDRALGCHVSRREYARRAGEQPRWLPGIRVPLGHYHELRPQLTLAEIKTQKAALLELREQLQARVRGQALYFPWNPYRDTIRTYQSYLAKVPQAAVSLFPQPRGAVDQAASRSAGIAGSSPAEQAADAVRASRSTRR